jgi:hypothetical protein
MLRREHCTLPLDMTDHVLGCDEHSSCKPVPWAEYRRLLTVSEKSCRNLTSYVENIYASRTWIDGLLKIREMLAKPMDKEGCVVCSVGDLLFDERRLPWFAGLRWEGEIEEYNRSLRCMEHWGDTTVTLNKWIESLCEESRAYENSIVF